jgi:hypothetical protein
MKMIMNDANNLELNIPEEFEIVEVKDNKIIIKRKEDTLNTVKGCREYFGDVVAVTQLPGTTYKVASSAQRAGQISGISKLFLCYDAWKSKKFANKQGSFNLTVPIRFEFPTYQMMKDFEQTFQKQIRDVERF